MRGNGWTVADVGELGLTGHFMGKIQKLSISIGHRIVISARRELSSLLRSSLRIFAES